MSTPEDIKVAILHGFTQEEVGRIIRAVKQHLEHPRQAAFAVTTKHSLQLKLDDVIQDIAAEHAYMTANPPGSKTGGTSPL